jgi:uncharacterized protein YjiS (DUF1127 family)
MSTRTVRECIHATQGELFMQDQSLRAGSGPHHRILADSIQDVVAPAAPARRSGTLLAVARGLWKIIAAVKGRQVVTRLAELDDHLLADIGVTRHDLSDALRRPLFRDPTNLLARCASDRGSRRNARP